MHGQVGLGLTHDSVPSGILETYKNPNWVAVRELKLSYHNGYI